MAIQSSYVNSLVHSLRSNPRALFKHLRQLMEKPSIAHVLTHNSTSVYSHAEKAELFHLHFNSVFTRSDFILPSVQEIPTPQDQLSKIVIDSSDVYNALSILDDSKAPGCDINPYILRNCSAALISPLTHLFSLSLSFHLIPTEWKMHKICPIYKEGDYSNASNYLPISLLCVISKVLEKNCL